MANLTSEYTHTQVGWRQRVMHGLVAAGCLVAGMAALVTHSMWAAIGFWSVAALFAFLVVGFDALTVSVKENSVQLTFGIGLYRTVIFLDDVEEVNVETTDQRRGGPVPGGILYKMGGRDVVKLKSRQGRDWLIGTDDPQGLSAAIQSVMASVRPNGEGSDST